MTVVNPKLDKIMENRTEYLQVKEKHLIFAVH